MTKYLSKPPAGVQIDWSNPLSRGLVGCWLFNEQAGLRVNDLSENNNHGVLTGFEPFSATSGWKGTGLQFDGVNDYVDAGNGASLNITNAITVSAWVNIQNTSASQNVVGKSTWLGGWSSIRYNIGLSLGTARWRVGNGTEINPTTIEVAYTATIGWQHIVGTYDRNTTSIYKNGVLQQSKVINITMVSSSNSLRISDNVGAYPFSGSIDEIRIYNRALNQFEIQQLYSQPYGTYKFMPQHIARMTL